MPPIAPAAEFCPELARTVALGLTSYGPALRLAVEYSEGGNDAHREVIHAAAMMIGLELLVFVRACALIDEFAPGDDPAPILPLARVLGESLAIVLLARHPETASRLPMASLDEVDGYYDTNARAWLRRFLDNLPERTDEVHDGD
jgi:hypothetical protein